LSYRDAPDTGYVTDLDGYFQGKLRAHPASLRNTCSSTPQLFGIVATQEAIRNRSPTNFTFTRTLCTMIVAYYSCKSGRFEIAAATNVAPRLTALESRLSGSVREWLEALRRPSTRWSLGALVLAGMIFGAVSIISFDYMIHETSSDAFCLVCHSQNIEPDYQGTVHATNHIGIRVSCQDCHIPKEFFPKLYVKTTTGAKDVYHTILGTIDTPEKFEAHRLAMASPTWEKMSANDSKACRYCHVEAKWDLAAQSEKARDFHTGALSRGKTCIDCHKGVAHPLPQGILPDHSFGKASEKAESSASQSPTSQEKDA
jgi:cytochrome c-type protein NapC